MPPVQLSSESQKAWDLNVAAQKSSPRFKEHESTWHAVKGSVGPEKYRQLQLVEGSPGFKAIQAEASGQRLKVLTTLKYTFEVVGKPLANGLYPLFLAFHGGGGGNDPVKAAHDNDQDWENHCSYYKGAVETGPKSGIFLSLRGIGDSHDMHYTKAGHELVQRLIENMILFESADPNRVYILGFSAGGDGVYQLSAHIANRLAASNMSAGHPNGVNMINILNLPLCLQVGENDTGTLRTRNPGRGFDRSLEAAGYGLALKEWATEQADAGIRGYECEIFLHPTPDPEKLFVGDNWKKPPFTLGDLYLHRHNSWENDLKKLPRPLSDVVADIKKWKDQYDTEKEFPDLTVAKKQANTNAVDWVCHRVRKPVPQRIKWHLKTRPNPPNDTIPLSEREKDPALVRKGQFYWLDIGPRTSKDLDIDLIEATMRGNTITIDSAKTYLRILLRKGEGMPDLSQHITIVLPKLPGANAPQIISMAAHAVENETVINQTLALNDPSFIFTADIVLTQDYVSKQWSATRTEHPPVLKRVDSGTG